jgi:hypothetical protein
MPAKHECHDCGARSVGARQSRLLITTFGGTRWAFGSAASATAEACPPLSQHSPLWAFLTNPPPWMRPEESYHGEP